MTKSKTAITTSIIDRKKPLVKDFVDPDRAVIEHLELRLPHVSHSIPKVNLLSQNKAGNVYRFRVNWWTEDKIVSSRYYEVEVAGKEYKISDKTISH